MDEVSFTTLKDIGQGSLRAESEGRASQRPDQGFLTKGLSERRHSLTLATYLIVSYSKYHTLMHFNCQKLKAGTGTSKRLLMKVLPWLSYSPTKPYLVVPNFNIRSTAVHNFVLFTTSMSVPVRDLGQVIDSSCRAYPGLATHPPNLILQFPTSTRGALPCITYVVLSHHSALKLSLFPNVIKKFEARLGKNCKNSVHLTVLKLQSQIIIGH